MKTWSGTEAQGKSSIGHVHFPRYGSMGSAPIIKNKLFVFGNMKTRRTADR